ncbi:hypothetical protein [Hymenobacter gummosus]|nr:hypothetical protein [Hymenobacter gummosus]
MTALIGVVGYLLNRSISQIDAKLSSTATSVDTMRADMNTMKLDMNGYAKLSEYQEKRLVMLETQNASLHRSVGSFDKFIAVQVALGKVHPLGDETIS